MARPEFLTAAALAVAGLALALWLAAGKPPPTPAPPRVPTAIADLPPLAAMPVRPLPEAPTAPLLPDLDLGPNGLPCGPVLNVTRAGAGFALLSLDAPCRGGAVVEITHGPMRFSDRVSPRGTFRIEVPVISRAAGFTARIGATLLAAGPVVGGEVMAQSGLAWRPPLDLSLSALEFGAAPGGPGHVTRASAGGSGRVLRLGDPALGSVSEVYLGPVMGGPGRVRLHVVAHAPDGPCDAPFPVAAWQADADGDAAVRDIRLLSPSCSGGARRVLLKNLLDDLKIAGQ